MWSPSKILWSLNEMSLQPFTLFSFNISACGFVLVGRKKNLKNNTNNNNNNLYYNRRTGVAGTNDDRGILSACGLTDDRAWPKEWCLWHHHLCNTHARPDKGTAHVEQRQSPTVFCSRTGIYSGSLIRPTLHRSIAYRLQHVPANSSRHCRLGIIESYTMSIERDSRQHERRRARYVSQLSGISVN